MKTIIKVLTLALLVAVMMTSCGKKKETNVIIAPKPVAQEPAAPGRMSDYVHPENVKWLNKQYKIEVHRFVADSLPMVQDETGRKYYDNLIRVRIIREDGSEFFNRVFSKRSFADYLDAKTRQDGALLGMVLDQVDGDNLVFGASVGSPDKLSDEYVPLLVTITRMGEVSIQKDNRLDADEQSAADNNDVDEGV